MNDPLSPLALTGPSFVRNICNLLFFGHGGAALIVIVSYCIQREILKVWKSFAHKFIQMLFNL